MHPIITCKDTILIRHHNGAESPTFRHAQVARIDPARSSIAICIPGYLDGALLTRIRQALKHWGAAVTCRFSVEDDAKGTQISFLSFYNRKTGKEKDKIQLPVAAEFVRGRIAA